MALLRVNTVGGSSGAEGEAEPTFQHLVLFCVLRDIDSLGLIFSDVKSYPELIIHPAHGDRELVMQRN